MSLILVLGLLLACFLSAQWITGRFYRSGVAQKILDVPNPRSSHVVATPRGGGVAIVLTTLSALVILGSVGAANSALLTGILGGGALVALIGFADDRAHIAPRWRLLGHLIAALWVVAWLHGLPSLPVLGFSVDLGWMGYVLAAIYLVWILNLTNFMDGIDAIAGVEVISVCLGGAVLYLMAVPNSTQWIPPLVLASATLGFLVWNWPPAKIFMGDGGSGFLGLMLAALSLQAAWVEPRLFWSWVVLLGVFVVDATVTLFLRVSRGEKFYEAHRSHAYQHAAQKAGAHLPVVLAVGAINLCWLLPLAIFVALGRLDGVGGVVVAYTPLVVTAVLLRAGRPGVKA